MCCLIWKVLEVSRVTMVVDAVATRKRSIELLGELKLAHREGLPFLDAELKPRAVDEILGRALVLNAIVAVAFGFDRMLAKTWIAREELAALLSPLETQLLSGEKCELEDFQRQVESLAEFAWVLGLVEILSLDAPAPRTLVGHFPDLKTMEPSGRFREVRTGVSLQRLFEECDFVYCVHCAIESLSLAGRRTPASLKIWRIRERRRALEWALFGEEWDEVTLDT